jgi:hypothetical protein
MDVMPTVIIDPVNDPVGNAGSLANPSRGRCIGYIKILHVFYRIIYYPSGCQGISEKSFAVTPPSP